MHLHPQMSKICQSLLFLYYNAAVLYIALIAQPFSGETETVW